MYRFNTISNFGLGVLIFSLFISFNSKAQNEQPMDSTTTRQPFLIFKTNYDQGISGLRYSQELKQQLENFNLSIYKPRDLREGDFRFTSKNWGKSFLEESYNVFQSDLSTYLPQPIDITRLPCKPNF